MASGLGNRAHLATFCNLQQLSRSEGSETRSWLWGVLEPAFSNVVYVDVTYNLQFELLLKEHYVFFQHCLVLK